MRVSPETLYGGKPEHIFVIMLFKKNTKLLISLLVLICATSGCMTLQEKESRKLRNQEFEDKINRLIVTTLSNVENCKPLGESSVTSSLIGTSESSAKIVLKKRAAAKGATHIVWNDIRYGSLKNRLLNLLTFGGYDMSMNYRAPNRGVRVFSLAYDCKHEATE